MIVGTAGHVDHGKTALVEALTGTNADRLAEERARGISIDLGFAYLDRSDGNTMGFVDVPGHEKFMKNMLAGASGIDFLLLVVAADDGIMPQTREHFAVACELGLSRGAVALTKCDLASAERLTELRAELAELVAETGFANAPVFETSVRNGEGVQALLAALENAAHQSPRDTGGATRFAVDRSFTLQGTGTVVTGTLWSGSIKPGDRLLLSPSGIEARVRSLHVHSKPASQAQSGDRCGINLAGLDKAEVGRGDFLLNPLLHAPCDRVDAELHLLDSEKRALRHWTGVRLHHGAGEFPARLALLGDDPISPGARGRVQIVLDMPIAAAINDRFIIRDAAGSRTMGGGRMVDLRGPRRRRKLPRRVEQLDAMALADPAASLAAQLTRWPYFVEKMSFIRDRALSPAQMDDVLAAVPHRQAQAQAVSYLFDEQVWRKLWCSVRGEISLFHQRFPQLLGPNVQRLMGAFGPRIPLGPATAVLEEMVRRKEAVREAGVYRLPDHSLGLDREDGQLWEKLRPKLGGEARFRPERVSELAQLMDLRDFDVRRVLKSMAKQGALVEIASDHYFLAETMVEIAGIIAELVEQSEEASFGVADLRDRLQNGRKVVIQLLEYFDRQGITSRRENTRIVDPGRLAQMMGSSPRTMREQAA